MTYEEKLGLLTKEAERILKEKHPEASEKQIERWVSGKDNGREKTNVGNCIIEGCDEPQKITHLCKEHYNQKKWQRNNPYTKYYQALFGNRDFCIKCGDGVWRQAGRW